MKVSIVCVTYLKENDKYLRVALESVKNQSYTDWELILVSSGDHRPENLPEYVKHIHHTERHHYPEAVNSGFKMADPNSKYYFMINDDVILTKDSLKNLVECVSDRDMVVNPISNCDNGFKYQLIMGHEKNGDFVQRNQRFYRYDELQGSFNELMNAHSIYPPGAILQDFVCFYATMMKKSVWDRVGGLDPQFKTGQDDIDFSIRAKNLGIPCVIALNALIWHYGGATADLSLSDDIRRQNIEYFTKKWGHRPP